MGRHTTGWSSHNVDNPSHTNPNPAGSIHVRAYLSPPYGGSNCLPGNVGTNLACTLQPGSYFPGSATSGNSPYGNTYFLVPATGQFLSEVECQLNGNGTPCWQDTSQMTLHTNATAWTPQLCYANGDPAPPVGTVSPFPNRAGVGPHAESCGGPCSRRCVPFGIHFSNRPGRPYSRHSLPADSGRHHAGVPPGSASRFRRRRAHPVSRSTLPATAHSRRPSCDT